MIEYTKISAVEGYTPEEIEQEVSRLEWIKTSPKMELPFMQGEGIKSVIKEFKIPKVSHIAIHGGITCHLNEENFTAGLYGVRAHYGKETREIYFADAGSHITPLGSKVIPEEKPKRETPNKLVCDFCGKVKDEITFIIGAAKKADWCMVYGTGKMTCPDCYERAQKEADDKINGITGA